MKTFEITSIICILIGILATALLVLFFVEQYDRHKERQQRKKEKAYYIKQLQERFKDDEE